MKNKQRIKKLVLASSLLTIAIILDIIISQFNLRMPFGGEFFGISMIPLVLVGLLLGLPYGLSVGLIFALYNFGVEYLIYLDSLIITLESWTGEIWTAWKVILLVILDYIIPFTAFGLSGLFKNVFEKRYKLVLSFVVIGVIGWLSSSFSGVLLWSSSIKYASDQVNLGLEETNVAIKIFSLMGKNLWLYSLSYNLIYKLTTVGSSIILSLLMYNPLKVLNENHFNE